MSGLVSSIVLGAAACVATHTDVPGGSLITRDMVQVVACELNAERPAVVYDRRSASVRTITALPAGTYLGSVVLAPSHTHDRGTQMVMQVERGAVRIERQVALAQTLHADQARVFVQGEDGSVFAVSREALSPAAPSDREPAS
ncbi:hypothetical protein RMQ97_14740 [Maricaulis sp. D1M11]